MIVDKNILKAHALLNGETLPLLAKAMGLERSSLYKKLSGKLKITNKEMLFIKDRYLLNEETFNTIFKK